MCIEVVIERGVLETEGVGGYFVCLPASGMSGRGETSSAESHAIRASSSHSRYLMRRLREMTGDWGRVQERHAWRHE